MCLDTITLEDLRVTIDRLIELHGPKKKSRISISQLQTLILLITIC